MWCIVGAVLENETRLLLLFLLCFCVVADLLPLSTLFSDKSSSLSQKTRLA